MADLRRSISRAIGARASTLHTEFDSGLPTPPHSLVVDLVTQEIHKGKKLSMNTSERDQVTPERLMQVGFAYAPPLIIQAAVENKVPLPVQSDALDLLRH